jgi:hypothetical protein
MAFPYTYQKSIKRPWAELFKMTKVKLGSTFIIDNESRFFSDA